MKPMEHCALAAVALTFVFLCLVLALPAQVVSPASPLALARLELVRPELTISTANVRLGALLADLPNAPAWESFLSTHDGNIEAYIDQRSGTPSAVSCAVPVIPGNGAGNEMTLEGLGQRLGRELAQVDPQAVAEAVRLFVVENTQVFGINLAQLGVFEAARITEDLWQVNARQVVGGVAVGFSAWVPRSAMGTWC